MSTINTINTINTISNDINIKDDNNFVNEINITVLITSITQREITIETAQYYSNICSEVIVVDEQTPHLEETDIKDLNERGITYIPYKDGSDQSLSSTYEKRLIAANHSNNKYLVHSNHDERYTHNGLAACIIELDNDKKLAFCSGQCIAVRKNNQGIYFTRSYKNLSGYENINQVDKRTYYHAEKYAPIGHYGVWRRDAYITASKKTVLIHNQLPSLTMMEEVIFELAADLSGNSKAVPELFWIRNRINENSGISIQKGDLILKTIKNKLHALFGNLDIQIEVIMNNFCDSHFAFLQLSLFDKFIIFLKRKARFFIKKKEIYNVNILLNKEKITYKKDDLSNVLKSMNSLLS